MKLSKPILISISVVAMMGSCRPSRFAITSSNESFDTLTKITAAEQPAFSPSGGAGGKHLVFSSPEKGGYYNIYLKDNALTQVVITKTSGNNFNYNPSYNEVADRIAFQCWNNNSYDIYYMSASEGKAISQVTNMTGNEFNPSWSPGGTQIIFEQGAAPRQFAKVESSGSASAGQSVSQNQIWIKDLNTGELSMLGVGSWPVFSPDGKRIAYVNYDVNQGKDVGRIWVMNANGENPMQLTDASLGSASEPCWSPNGKSIAFQLTRKKKKDSDIYSIDITGEGLRPHTTNDSNDFSPHWTSDDYLYFCSDRGSVKGDFQIWRCKM